MYTPRFNQIGDRATLLEAMRAYSFAILFSAQTNSDTPADADGSCVSAATHLPLVVSDDGPHGLLEGHFARANPHWQSLAGRETLVVFSGPHSYVSPSLYEESLAVPTWNYIAIHAHGTLQLIEDDAGKEALLAGLIATHEPAYAEHWRSLPEGYRRTMLAGIVGFRIPIARIEGKFKLSQNRSERERRSVQSAQASGDADQRALAAWMTRLND
ncbi:MAG TPA: FMN-binding negative transcriptional regulator [Terracidiphilus sp.]|jgi:transcriptional regulator|nr:FMN-binding negative transcriptional regulator [Terracidiphilus sp.]